MCHEPIVDTKRLPSNIQDLIYRPSEDEQYHVKVEFEGVGTRKSMLEEQDEENGISVESPFEEPETEEVR